MKKTAFGNIFFSVCLLIISTLFLVYSESMLNMLTLILGIAMILYSAYNLFLQIRSEKKSIISIAGGAVILIIGLVLVARPSIVNEFISFVIGIYVLVSCISDLSKAKNSEKKTPKILSILGIVIGFLCILGKFLVPSFIMSLVALTLIICCIINIVDTILLGE